MFPGNTKRRVIEIGRKEAKQQYDIKQRLIQINSVSVPQDGSGDSGCDISQWY